MSFDQWVAELRSEFDGKLAETQMILQTKLDQEVQGCKKEIASLRSQAPSSLTSGAYPPLMTLSSMPGSQLSLQGGSGGTQTKPVDDKMLTMLQELRPRLEKLETRSSGVEHGLEKLETQSTTQTSSLRSELHEMVQRSDENNQRLESLREKSNDMASKFQQLGLLMYQEQRRTPEASPKQESVEQAAPARAEVQDTSGLQKKFESLESRINSQASAMRSELDGVVKGSIVASGRLEVLRRKMHEMISQLLQMQRQFATLQQGQHQPATPSQQGREVVIGIKDV